MVDFVAEVLHKQITTFEMELNNCSDESNKFHEKRVASLEKKIAELNSKELAMWESQVDPTSENRMPPHIFQALTDKLIKEREETEAALVKARKALSAPIDYEKRRETFQAALDALLDDKRSVAEKNHLLKACIDRITYHREPAQRVLGKGAGRQYTTPPIDLDITLKV
jgi:hypothetical protein